jgi:hypothetical protein
MKLGPVAATLLLSGLLFAADPGLVSLAMPDARVVAGINVQQVTSSPLGQYLLAQIGQHEAELQQLVDATGFDPRHDLHEVLFASKGEAGGRSGIALVRGEFDVPRIIEAAQADGKTIEPYKGVDVISGGHGVAFLDSTLAIAGDLAAVHAAIDRRSAPTSIGADLATQVNQLSTTQDAWFVSLVPPNQLQAHHAGAGTPPAEAFGTFGKVLQASGGIKLGADVTLSAQSVSQTEQDAAALGSVLKILAGMVRLRAPQGQAGRVATLLQNLAVTADGLVTRLSLSIPEQQLEQFLAAAHPQPEQPVLQQ